VYVAQDGWGGKEGGSFPFLQLKVEMSQKSRFHMKRSTFDLCVCYCTACKKGKNNGKGSFKVTEAYQTVWGYKKYKNIIYLLFIFGGLK